jgi:3',5'-nucleoside bisphosphate phosphatase
LIDLHVHTDRSDGSTAPKDIVRQASVLGIEALGIADHDTLAGYDEALPEAATQELELICGVELSTRPEWQKSGSRRQPSIHLLGYFLLSQPTAEFRKWLLSQQESRAQRNFDLIAKLQRFGLEITIEDAALYGRNQVGRPHFARVLFEKGYVSTLQQAFDLYLGDDAMAAVERDEPSIEEGIKRIREGGGFASLAHPVRLLKQNAELADFIRRLRDAGLDGLEVFHSEHDSADTAAYLKLARRFDLIPTGGSDFHGENKPAIQMGTGIDGNVKLPYEFLDEIREMCYAKR